MAKFIKFLTIIFTLSLSTSAIPLNTTPFNNLVEIKQETNWDDVQVRKHASFGLNLISQGFVEERINQDSNYYYPGSAGKGVDIIVIDSDFNFNYQEFSNFKDRTAECLARVNRGNVTVYDKGVKICHDNAYDSDPDYLYHGEMVADIAAGRYFGVAENANIYGVVIDDLEVKTVTTALLYILDYIKENKRAHKTIINISVGQTLGSAFQYDVMGEDYKNAFHELTEAGAIVFTSAGNNHNNVNNPRYYGIDYPCVYDDVICVGGTNNNATLTQNMYQREENSNFGKEVNIFAPYYVGVDYMKKGAEESTTLIAYGTSFSAPVVAGVAATIISENPDIEFDKDTMLEYLTKFGLKDVVDDVRGSNNLFVNNGKHIVYTEEN